MSHTQPLPERQKKEVLAMWTLENNLAFFLQSAIILGGDWGFELIVIQRNRVILERSYRSLAAAKNGFSHLYQFKALFPGTRPLWRTIE